ncbi:carbohydrate ABC transporter permease [Phytoactinopolyspora mesophila]|uniref:ABC transporter permease subunit n=1 Tax=Phytoactinopolyspora mesophila TaxID=2650750 RepID=A0A7K3M984_9ACTN|nr:carbohydrate ABC transporter permease [Phytoactinopolyspora mesophila]NDL59875.1 ABC transporter permease subunit [Phytoactinopolyspora mesophila]
MEQRHTTLRSFRRKLSDPLFNAVTVLVLGGALVAIIYPLYFILIASVSEPDQVYEGNVWLAPAGFTLDGYERIVSDPAVWRGLMNSLLYTGLAVTISVCLVLTAGYALSRRDMPGRSMFMLLFLATMFYDGGMIPRYLVVRDLGMLDSIWAMVLPNAVAVWNLIIARVYFESNIPGSLREAAHMDGASDLRFFFRIVLPMSKPLIAVMIMIHMVWNWNAFFDALIFLTDDSKYPLQLVLRNILVQNEVSTTGNLVGDLASYAEQQKVAELIKYGMIVFASLPMLLLFPFLQKYFTKGMLIGAVKN